MASASTADNSTQADLVHRILSARSHYEVLSGVTHQSSDEEVKKTYRLLALKTHPDKNKHERAEDAFKRVHNAFLALETEEKRVTYHRRGGTGLGVPGEDDDRDPFGGGFHARYHDPFDFFEMFMGGGRRRGGGGLDEIMMMMMLQQMMGGGRGGFGGVHFHGGPFSPFSPPGVYAYEDDDGDYQEFYGDEYDYFHEEEEEEEDPELVGVFYDQLRDVYICEGCGIELRNQDALRRHIATEKHQYRYADAEEDDDDDDDEDSDEDEDEEDEDDEEDSNDSQEEYDEVRGDGLVFNTRDKVFVCRPCGVSLKRKAEMDAHIQGKRHKSELGKEDFYCEVCDVTTRTKEDKQRHLSGSRHLRLIRQAHGGATTASASSSARGATAASAAKSSPPRRTATTSKSRRGRRS